MPLFHMIAGQKMPNFLMIPFLFDRGRKSLEFVSLAREIGDGFAHKDFTSAYLIMDSYVSLASGGTTSLPEDYPEAFDHLHQS